jgi:hypothetical protein
LQAELRRAGPQRRRPSRGLRAALCGLAACALLAPAAGAFSWVSYPVLVAQIRTGPVIRVIVNVTYYDAEIKFRNLYEWKARFAPGQEHALVALVRARHIPLKFAAPPRTRHRPAPVHHHLRYIAAAVLGAALLIGAGALVFRRRASAAGARPAEAGFSGPPADGAAHGGAGRGRARRVRAGRAPPRA